MRVIGKVRILGEVRITEKAPKSVPDPILDPYPSSRLVLGLCLKLVLGLGGSLVLGLRLAGAE